MLLDTDINQMKWSYDEGDTFRVIMSTRVTMPKYNFFPTKYIS